MALDRLTKVDGGGISTTSDYRVGIITASKFVGPFDGSGGNFSGVVTATNGVFSGNISAVDGNFSGNVTIGGTLTYEDVTNIDSVGLITARNGIEVSTGTATTALVVNGDARVTGILTVGTSSLKLDGPNNLVNVGTALTLGHSQGVQFHTQNLHSAGFEVNQINASGIITATGADINGDLDVDGHTNLDNVSIAGMSTITGANIGNAQFTGSYVNVDGNLDIADSIRHLGDSNTKIRFPAADQISFETGGTNRLKIHTYSSNNNVEVDASSHLSLADNGSGGRFIYIGDGDASSTGYMHLQPGGGSQGFGGGIRLYSHSNSTNAGGVYIGKSHASSGSIIFGNGGMSPLNEYLRITSGGRLGLGLASPQAVMHIEGGSEGNLLQLSNTHTGATNTDGFVMGINSSLTYIYNRENKDITFGTNNTERLRIDSSGNVLTSGNTQLFGSNTSDGSDNKALMINGGGAVSDSRGGYLLVHGNEHSSNPGITRLHAGNVGTAYIAFNTSGNEKLRLDSSGRLYLGSNFTGGNGDVDDLVISGTGHRGITVCSTSGGISRITFADGLSGTAAVIGSIAYEHSVDAMDFYTNALRMMRVDRANSTERLQIGAINNNSTGTRLVLGAGNNIAATAVINTQDANINALTLSNWDGSTTTNKVNMHFDASGIAGFDVGIPAATTAFKIANTSGGGGYLNLKSTGETMIYRSGVIQADINNSVSGHKFVSQCDDNSDGFEIYQQHGSTSSRNTLAVYNNFAGSKHANFYVRGDNQVFISGNKNTTGLVMDGTSSGTYYGETGNTIDFRMNNEVNQFTGNPAARIASYLDRGNNGFGLKFYGRNSASSFAAMVQLSADYEWEPCSDLLSHLGSADRSWNKAYIANAYPDQGTEYRITSGSYSNAQWHDTAFGRDSMGGLDLNGVYIVTAYADLYTAMGGNYGCNYTWIVGVRNQYTNQTLVNTCPLLSVTGHSTNNFGASGATVGDGIRLGTSRTPASSGGEEQIVWRPAASTSEINNTAGRTLVFRVQRIGRSSLG